VFNGYILALDIRMDASKAKKEASEIKIQFRMSGDVHFQFPLLPVNFYTVFFGLSTLFAEMN